MRSLLAVLLTLCPLTCAAQEVESPPCRHCRQLAYDSQQKSAKYRALHGAEAIRMKLGGSPSLVHPFPPKPKGMHWHTYRCLYIKAMRLEEAFMAALADFVSNW